MPPIVKKNGKTYYFGPKQALNDYPEHKDHHFGDRLQEFFDANNIDIDLDTGLGADIKNLYCVCTDRSNTPKELARVFDNTDYADQRKNNMNMGANMGFRRELGRSTMTTNIAIYRPGETSPRMLSIDSTGNPSLSEPIAQLDPETMKPAKPNWFKQFMHWINSSLFERDFMEYEEKTNRHRAFVRKLNDMKTLFERENPKRAEEKRADEERAAKDENLVNLSEKHLADQQRLNTLMDDMLGPNAKGSDELIENKVYRKENYEPEKLEYPQTDFSEHEIALMGYAALSDTVIGCMRDHLDGITDEENAIRNYTHYTHDVFFYSGRNARENSDSSVKSFNAARQKARDCIDEYSKGNKKPLAELLGNSIKMQNIQLNGMVEYNHIYANSANVTKELLGILGKDEELKNLSGLTEDDLTAARGYANIADIYKKQIKGQSMMQQYALGKVELTRDERKEYIGDIMLGSVVGDMANNSIKEYIKSEEHQKVVNGVDLVKDRMPVAYKELEKAAKSGDAERLNKIQEEVNGLPDKLNAALFKIDKDLGLRTASPVVKLLGGDSDGTRMNELKQKIAETDTFRIFNGMEAKQFGELQRDNVEFGKKMQTAIAQTANNVGKNVQPKNDQVQNVIENKQPEADPVVK